MLTLITGKVGGGKSYLGVETALTALKEGAVVHTNLPLKWEKLERDYPGQLVRLPDNPRRWIRPRAPEIGDPEDVPMIESDLIVGGAEGQENLVIIDEASFQYGAEDQATKEQKDKLRPVRQLVTLQRHVGIDIIFITQSSKKIDAKLREDASERIHCIKAAQMPFIGWLAQPLFGDFLRVYYDQSGVKISRSWHRFKKSVGDCYDTHGFRSSVAIRVDPTRVVKSGETGKKGMVKILGAVALALCAIIFGAYSTYRSIVPSGQSHVSDDKPKGPFISAVEKTTRRVNEMLEVTWDAADEFVKASVIHSKGLLRVSTREGLKLFVGCFFDGEMVTACVPFRDRYYFICESGRVLVVRPYTHSEMKAWREEALSTSQPQSPLETVQRTLLP